MDQNEQSPKERRRYPRTQINMSLQAIVFDPDGGDVVERMEMVDISRGGLGVMTSRPMYPGQRLMLRLPGVNLSVRNLCAVVRRCLRQHDQYHVGLEFDVPMASLADEPVSSSAVAA